jgi:hypothetical protein
MKFQNLFCCLFLLFVQNLLAKNPLENLSMPRVVFVGELACNLPAPDSLYVDAIGSNWVIVSWDAVPGAFEYRLQAFDGDSGDPLDSPIFVDTTTLTALVSIGGNGGTAHVRIWSVCKGGGYNPSNYAQTGTFDTIIIDIVSSGFTVPSYNNTQVVGTGPAAGANISWTGNFEYFNIQYTYNDSLYNRQFSLHVKFNGTPDRVIVRIGDHGNLGEHILLIPEIENNNSIAISVRFRPVVSSPDSSAFNIVTLKPLVREPFTQGKIYRMSENSLNCIVERLYTSLPPMRPKSPSAVASERGSETLPAVKWVVSPNPFRQDLTVQTPEASIPHGTVLRIFDVLGTEKMSIQLPADQSEHRISTPQLKAGVYFMHLESKGRVELLKVVKVE